MQWFHNRSTLTKLLGTFASVCALMAIVGYMGISTAQSIKAGLDEVGGSVLPSTRSVATAQYNLAKAQRDIRTAVLSHDKASTDAALTKMTGEITLSETAWTAYKVPPFSPEEDVLIPQFEQGYKAWRAIIDQATAEAGKNTPESNLLAQDLVSKSAPLATTMNTALDSLSALQTTQAGATLDEADAAFGHSLQILLALIVGGIVLGLGMGFYVARSLATPLKAMVAAANGIAEGDLNQEIALDRNDEVGQAAAAFRRAIIYLRSMAEVADAMADGDLTRTVEPQSARDGLGTAFKKMIANLRDLVGQVQGSALSLADTSAQLGDAAAQTGSAVQQVTMAVQNVASGAQETSRSAQETTASVTQLSQVIDGIAPAAPRTRRGRSRPPARRPARWRPESKKLPPMPPRWRAPASRPAPPPNWVARPFARQPRP